jgi:predicted N-acetyltransferase YhbS
MTMFVPLSEIDPPAVEALLDAAFGADRFSRTAYMLRAGAEAVPELSFAALDADQLVGTIQCWPIALETDAGPTALMTLVGPVAVSPEVQRGGIGRQMMGRMLAAADAHGHDALLMIGDPDYYERFFQFSAATTGGWDLPGPVERHRLLARISRPGGMPPRGLVVPFRAVLNAEL